MSEWPLKAAKWPSTVLLYDNMRMEGFKGFLFSTAQVMDKTRHLPVTVFWMDGTEVIKTFMVWGRDPIEEGFIHQSGKQYNERMDRYVYS